jgi:peroxiredoxin-like protein
MKPLPHLYEARLSGGPTGYATVSVSGLPDLTVAAPADWGGPGDSWSPEHLLIAAIESCFLLTLRAVARASKVEFASLKVFVSGAIDRKDGVTRFTEVVLRPVMTIPAGTDRERALRVMEKAEKSCLITSSLSTPVRLEAEVLVG